MWASRRLVHALCVNAKRCPSGRHIHSLNLLEFIPIKPLAFISINLQMLVKTSES
jgi:hypothetical protein